MPKPINRPLFAAALTALIPAMTAWGYSVNYPLDQKISASGRSLNALVLNTPALGVQTVNVGQASDQLLYHDLSDQLFVASPGDEVTASFDWIGTWMHGYVYLDRDNDGEFSHELGDKSSIPEGSDVMAFSNYSAYNSAGKITNNGNVGVNPPAFTIPANLQPGVIYRMRYKVDWNSIDPGGNDANGTIHQQLITTNGGAIADVSLLIAEIERTVSASAEHGSITLADGTAIDAGSVDQGKDFIVRITPDPGYILVSLDIASGTEIRIPDGYTAAFDNSGLATTSVPGILISGDTYTIPASLTRGSLYITAHFADNGGQPAEGNYESTLSGDKKTTEGITAVSFGTDTLLIEAPTRYYFADASLPVLAGSIVEAHVAYKGTEAPLSLMVDMDQNGVFTPVLGECVAESETGSLLPEFTFPEGLPTGVYRARLTAGAECEVDFLINLHQAQGQLDSDVLNGMALTRSSQPMANTVAFGSELRLRTKTLLEGFEPVQVTVRHGHGLDGPQYIRGNRQWDELTFDAGAIINIPGEAVDGDVLVMGEFAESSDSPWTTVWSDEFDADSLVTDNWIYQSRQSSTWNKRVARAEERPFVNKFGHGHYDSYSIATPEEFIATDSQPIITGAINSSGKFYLTGGWIEARLRTRGHSGNFPAFWMMPSDGSAGWPNCGEIDIWEQIDNGWTTFHTVHTAWTKSTLGTVSRQSPTSSGSTSADPNLWHVYALEWDKDEYLKWYVDGNLVFTYRNQHFSEGRYTEDMTWPFAKAFYVILNQSVGDGSWAANGDVSFEYLTEFDYVRCYQRKDAIDYYSTADGHVTAIETTEADVDSTAHAEYYNLQGVRLDGSSLAPGLYIVRRGNHSTKTLVR